MPEFRKDPLLERWVIIAAERAKRPHGRLDSVPVKPKGVCPFCAGNEGLTPPPVLVLNCGSVPHKGGSWTVRVVPNKYPALVDQIASGPAVSGRLFYSAHGAGVHEVAIESPRHVTEMSALSETEIEQVLCAYRQRMRHFRGDPRWRYALIFKNQGTEAGATIDHSHSQITALPVVPKDPLEEMEAAKKYYLSDGRCVYCDIIAGEKQFRERIVAENSRFIIFCPFASRVAGETWILPKRHSACFEFGSRKAVPALARALRETLIRLRRSFDKPPVNYVLHSNALNEPENDHFHWHLEILPKLHHVAGFEWGSGWYMNPLAPENAAKRLREIAL